ncbi:MAG: DNA polymerase I [bacterium]
MIKRKKKLMILDGNALIHRSFHALPPTLATKSGEVVNAVYGFTSFLLKAIQEFKPEYIALTLDKAGPTFRHEQYKEYKGTRTKAPDELYDQFPRVKEIANALNIPIYEKSGFEADDLIGTITKEVNGEIDKIIVTGDMDTLQLVNDSTFVYSMSRGLKESQLYDEKQVRAKYGFNPDQLIDFKALRGDPSDNIPGVRGIGEKTALELIQNFKTLEGVYKNIDSPKIKDRIRELLKEYQKDAKMSKELATIKRDVKINFKLADVVFGDYDQDKVIKLFSELEFKSLLSKFKMIDIKLVNDDVKIKSDEYADKFERNAKMFNYILIDTEKKFKEFLTELKKVKEFTFDTETSDFDTHTAKLLGISFSWEKGLAYFVKMHNPEKKASEDTLFNYKSGTASNKNSIAWLEKLKPIMEDEKIKKNAHNMKFDTKVLSSFDVNVQGINFDTMIASYLLNPDNRQHKLDTVTFSELGHEKISVDDLLGAGKNKISFSEVPLDRLAIYSCEDSDFTQRLVRKLSVDLKTEKLTKLFNEIEMPLVSVLAIMENNGILIDAKYLEKFDQELDEKLNNLQKKIIKLAGQDFNISSIQQLREVLFNKLKISTEGISRTKTGFSTGASELDKLKGRHEIIDLILEYRELNKLSNTYVKALPKLINKVTGRVHTSFNQTVAATGRLSSSNPNLQNIPVRTELGSRIRKSFIVQKGKKLLAFDYSQIELRLAAHISGDPKMIKAFNDNQDIHTATAAQINQIDLKDVTKAMRRAAKATNFGIIYGQGPHGLSETAGISFLEAKAFIEKYFKVYKGIKKYIDDTIQSAKEDGYVETLFNRRRYLSDINSSMVMIRKQAERMAVNTPLQGTAADMIKVAMIKIQDLINRKYRDSVKMVLQVHDELLFEVDEKEVEKISKDVKSIMENIIKLKIPVIVDVKIGDNWEEMKKYEGASK